jgi:hypothetical protein
MSRYQENDVEFFDKDCLKEALGDMGLTFNEYEELTELEDYLGKKRKDTKAHIIVPRSNWAGQLVNDVGFAFKEDGKVTAYIDNFFTNSNDAKGKFLNPLTQRYGELKVKKTSARMRLRVSGEETLADGTRRIKLRR